MNYLKAEHLKFKRTISNKLLWIAPLMTALFAWIVSGFYGFQYMTFYWWYAFLLPGTIAILCALSHQKEERAGKYYSVLSLPISLQKFELAKAGIIAEKLLIASLFLALFVSIKIDLSAKEVIVDAPLIRRCMRRMKHENCREIFRMKKHVDYAHEI